MGLGVLEVRLRQVMSLQTLVRRPVEGQRRLLQGFARAGGFRGRLGHVEGLEAVVVELGQRVAHSQ